MVEHSTEFTLKPVYGIKVWYKTSDISYDTVSFIGNNINDTSWSSLPDNSILYVMLYENNTLNSIVTRRAVHGHDYYFVENGVVYGTDLIENTTGTVRQGVIISDDLFTQVEQEAFNDYSVNPEQA